MTINGQQRIIEILLRLLEGEKLSKQGLMHDYGKQESTIQRDIGMIESVLHDALKVSPIGVLNREEKGNYYLQGNYLAKDFKEEEILALLKILLSTRIFSKNDLARLIEKILSNVPEQKRIKKLIANEWLHYENITEESLFERIKLITQGIEQHQLLAFDYQKNGETRTFHRVPQDIFYSDLYFFMISSSHTAQDDRDYSQLNKFRINNMNNLRILSNHQKKKQTGKFEAGFLRNHTSLPFFCLPITLVIDYYYDPVYVLDRFPDSKIIKENENGSVRISIQANDGYGVKMWLLGQGETVCIISPKHMRDYVINDMIKNLERYQIKCDKNTSQS